MDDLLNSRFYGYALQGFINHNRKEQLNNHLFFWGGHLLEGLRRISIKKKLFVNGGNR
jgi:hypothetical protein